MYITRSATCQRRSPQHRPVAQRLPRAAADWDSTPEWLADTDVLPEQFFAQQTHPRTERPETALMRAVLADALACFQHGLVNSKRRVQRVAQEAEAWFLNDDDHWLFSFVSICAVPGLEPASIRRELRRWSQGSLKPVRRGLPRLGIMQRRLVA